jgi:nucleoside-diphosphate-sugar epimerase
VSGDRPLVTVLGASGFVGSAVVAALATRPVTVRAVARTPVEPPRGGDVRVLSADLTVADQLRDAVAGSDAVVHVLLPSAGWRADGEESERVNVGVMRDLVRCLRERPASGLPPVVAFAGSVSQAGPLGHALVDGSEPDHPEGSYDLQKQAAEQALTDATRDGVLRGTTLRLPTVYGSGPGFGRADRGVVATMVRRALSGQPLTVWGDGAVLRDLVHVDDVAAAFVAALDSPDALAGRHWVVGSGRGLRLRDIFTAVADAVSVWTGSPPVPVESVPAPETALRTDASGVVVDSSAFAAVTGWQARTSWGTGLARLVAAVADDVSSVDA